MKYYYKYLIDKLAYSSDGLRPYFLVFRKNMAALNHASYIKIKN